MLEVLIALLVLSVVMGAMLFTLTRLDTVSRQQLTITDVQQAARAAHEELVRTLRIAGRGGLTQERGAAGPAVTVRDNVGEGGGSREVALGHAASPLAVAGTDVVTVRGVLTSDLLAVDYRDRSHSGYEPTTGQGFVVVSAAAPTGFAQDLSPLIAALEAGREEALVLIDAVDTSTYGVARLVIDGPVAADATEIRLSFDAVDGKGSAYASLSRNFDGAASFPALNAVAFVGVLEEYRYYVRDDAEMGPTLARARMYPATELPWDDDADELSLDFATGVADLQVALGFDSQIDGAFDDDDDAEGEDDQIVERARDEASADDWLYNQTADDADDALWIGPWLPAAGATVERPHLYMIRVSTLAIARQIERGHPSPLLPGLEDRVYTTLADDPINGDVQRLKRKRLLQTVVKPRNLS